MNKIWISGIGVLAAAAAFAQAPTILYAPVKVIKDQNIGLKSWGSGTASETDEMAYEGGHSIRISTRNYFAGGLLQFGNTVNLSDKFGDKNNLLRITYRSADSGTVLGGGPGGPGGGRPGGPGGPGGLGGPGGPGGLGGPGAGGGGGKGGGGAEGGGGLQGGGGRGPGGGAGGGPGFGPGGPGQGGRGPGGGPGGFGPGQGGRGPGGPGGQMGGASAPSKLQSLRLIVTTTDGKKSEAYIPLAGGANDKWRSVAIPLQAISGFDKTNKDIKEIAFAGDVTTTFYIGDLRVVNDTTPITGEPNIRELNLALGDYMNFSASGYGGSSILKYSWDFDDRDGIQEDVVGQNIRKQFRKPGTFTITLTISDEFGLKKSYSTTMKAKVNP